MTHHDDMLYVALMRDEIRDRVDAAAEERFLALFNAQPRALEKPCRKYHMKSIRLFGSVLRDDFGPDSDVDMMVEFGAGAPSGWKVFGFDDEMSALIGRKADVMHGQPVRYIRDEILAEARTVYAADDERSPKEVEEL